MNLRALGTALAVAVVALTAACDADEEPSADPPPSQSTTVTTPPRPTAWVDALPVGRPPAVGYVIGHTYHSPDGRILRLPSDRGITSIARLGDGWLVTDDRVFEGTLGVLLLDERGRFQRELGTVAGAPVLSRDGDRLRWITFSPAEVGPADRSPTRMHVGEVATGAVRSRVLDFTGDHVPLSPAVPGPPTGEAQARRAAPTPAARRAIWSTTWEDRDHVLAAIFVRDGRSAAVLRLDARTGEWELAVDWTPTERTSQVAFETRS